MRRNVGRMGEAELRRWVSQVGIIMNPSTDHDASGWDFFLEWPQQGNSTREITLPIDRRPNPIQCLVQVKLDLPRFDGRGVYAARA